MKSLTPPLYPMNVSSRLRRVSGAALLALFAVNAHAAIVFQADFNGSGSGTGGANDIVTSGGTGVELNVNPAQSNVDVVFSSANPLAPGAGGYLRLSDNGL